MSSNTNNVITNDSTSILNSEINNKGFALLDQVFREHGWHMTKNEMNYISYGKKSLETDFFDIIVEAKNIRVSVPIKNSPFQYVTTFNDYFSASEYVEARFFDFIKKLS
jgi:hypothetical protein